MFARGSLAALRAHRRRGPGAVVGRGAGCDARDERRAPASATTVGAVLSGAMIRTGPIARLRAGALLVTCLVGCSVGCFVDQGADTAGAGDAGTSTTGPTSTSGAPTGTGTGGATSDTGDDALTDSCGFLCTSTGEPGGSCDLLAQDCPEGQKCAPYWSGGEMKWDLARCVPVTGVGAPGDPCTREGAYSGLDDCRKGALCWQPGGTDLTCTELCQGSEFALSCEDASTQCVAFDPGSLDVCMATCDPLLQDCMTGHVCVPVSDYYICVVDASGDAGAVFDPCDRVNGCDVGLLCAIPSAATECPPDEAGCCLPLCSVMEGAACPGVGQSCVALYPPETAIPGHEDVGVCALPG